MSLLLLRAAGVSRSCSFLGATAAQGPLFLRKPLTTASQAAGMGSSTSTTSPQTNGGSGGGGGSADEQPVIIGITGTNGAGKGTVVEVLMQEMGFKHYSARSYLSKILTEQGKELSRGNMNELANDLRAANHPAILIQKLLEEAQKDGGRAIIESIRTPAEATLLRKFDRFRLLAVDADPRVRCVVAGVSLLWVSSVRYWGRSTAAELGTCKHTPPVFRTSPSVRLARLVCQRS
jgi:adenylate kinase family enzyme